MTTVLRHHLWWKGGHQPPTTIGGWWCDLVDWSKTQVLSFSIHPTDVSRNHLIANHLWCSPKAMANTFGIATTYHQRWLVTTNHLWCSPKAIWWKEAKPTKGGPPLCSGGTTGGGRKRSLITFYNLKFLNEKKIQ